MKSNVKIKGWTYILSVLKCVEYVVWQTGEQIDDEPALQVVQAYELGIRYDLTGLTNVGRVKVENNVEKKDDVDNAVDH